MIVALVGCRVDRPGGKNGSIHESLKTGGGDSHNFCLGILLECL